MTAESHPGNCGPSLGDALARAEARHHLALQTARLGMWDFDCPNEALRFDSPSYELLGFPAETSARPIGDCLDYIHPDDRGDTLRQIRALVEGDATAEVRLIQRIRTQSRGYRWFESRGRIAERDAEGRPLIASGTLRDVTDQHQSRLLLDLEREILALAASGHDLESSLNYLVRGLEGIWIEERCAVNLCDCQQGIIVSSVAPAMPASYHELVVGLNLFESPSLCSKVVQTGKVAWSADIPNDPDYAAVAGFYDQIHVRSCWSVPVSVASDVVATVCVFHRDARTPTEEEIHFLQRIAQTTSLLFRRQIQDEQEMLLERQLRATDRLEGLGKLAGGIAHDFNNLLTIIQGQVAALKAGHTAGPPDACQMQATRQIGEAADLATALCQQLLAYRGDTNTEPSAVNLAEVIERVVGLVRPQTGSRITFEVACQASQSQVWGDEAALFQAIFNLVGNAIEAIGENEGTIAVRCGCRPLEPGERINALGADPVPAGEYVCVSVGDTGRGIVADNQDRIFEPFFSTKDAGRGLGLSTVFGIVRQHGGAISLQSEPGHGSQFSIFLPRSRSPIEAASQARSPLPNAAPDLPPNATSTIPPITVAVIDDDARVRESVAKLLEINDFQVQQFAGGLAAIEDWERLILADVILLDEQMPCLNGLETYHRIRESAPEVPICFASGGEVSEGCRLVMEDDAFCVAVSKPVQIQSLAETFENLVRR